MNSKALKGYGYMHFLLFPAHWQREEYTGSAGGGKYPRALEREGVPQMFVPGQMQPTKLAAPHLDRRHPPRSKAFSLHHRRSTMLEAPPPGQMCLI